MRKVTHYAIRERDGEITTAHATPEAMASAVKRRIEAIGERVAEGGYSAVALEFTVIPVTAEDVRS